MFRIPWMKFSRACTTEFHRLEEEIIEIIFKQKIPWVRVVKDHKIIVGPLLGSKIHKEPNFCATRVYAKIQLYQ